MAFSSCTSCISCALVPAIAQNGQFQDLHAFFPGSCSTTAPGVARGPRSLRIWARGGKSMPPKQGRGYNSKKASAQGVQKRMSNRDLDQEGWVQVAEKDDLTEGKNKAILRDNEGYVLVQRGSLLYTIKANCTTCQFPMIDGKRDSRHEIVSWDPEASGDFSYTYLSKVLSLLSWSPQVELVGEGDDLTIECPLCHSKFSVVDGEVAEYCPKDGPLQWFVGTLKSKTEPMAAKIGGQAMPMVPKKSRSKIRPTSEPLRIESRPR
ncbi:hypothetical protein AXG93_291s1110 [Marchantia polymorpha subsp. ruderalis]|uniref:Rieske domain-containing protein n=1 Tax=Marchantia polymorpha subsp. ruderalis TaxID=1480154 RepID=A0A176VG41_MARPO|nr:hypothetical protein AXG93_291s1110 [Marchantia polymorpha subsp. ruderalis]